MYKFILSAILILLAILFVCLHTVWAGFSYLAIVCVCLLMILWSVLWVLDYIFTYKKSNLQERYKLYCALLVNSSSLTLDYINQNEKVYYKKFKKTLIKEKIISLLKIFLIIGAALALIIVLCVKGDLLIK